MCREQLKNILNVQMHAERFINTFQCTRKYIMDLSICLWTYMYLFVDRTVLFCGSEISTNHMSAIHFIPALEG